MNKTTDFLQRIDALSKTEIPAAVFARARYSLQDYLAVTCAGSRFQAEKLAKYAEFACPEPGAFKAVGTGKQLALKEAVFLNGLNGHALDFDDGTNSGIIHLGSPIFSLLLPLAERYEKTVDEVLRAAVIGYEVSYTLAVSMQPGHKALGFHATGTCGVLGESVAASYLLGFTDEERFQAFAAACVAASGMLLVLDDGSELKPYNVAKSALLALTSVQLAKSGFKGHPDPLGAARGYLKMMTGSAETELKPLLLNGTYAISKSYTKPYASCRYTHPSVEAAIHLRSRFGIKAEDVERIDIDTYSLAVSGHDHTEIPGSYSAKMSIPYSTAAGLIYGKAGLQEFSEDMVTDPEMLALTAKVHVRADDALSAAFPAEQTAIVTIRTKTQTVTERVDFPKGEPENPMNEEEFRSRYHDLMDYAGIAADAAGKVYDLVNDPAASVRDLLQYL